MRIEIGAVSGNNYNGRGLRASRIAASVADATGANSIVATTAISGPPGPPLRAKYCVSSAPKTTRKKSGGNSGRTGRKARAAERGHRGGQESPEHRAQRTADRAAHMEGT